MLVISGMLIMTDFDIIEKQMKDFVAKLPNEYNCFVIIYRVPESKDDSNVSAFGAGCPACAIELINLIRDEYQHTGPEQVH
jgi:hypothetical protein